MTDKQIRGLLLAKGYTMSQAAEEIGVSINMVWMVIHSRRTSYRVQRWIADVIGKSVEELWPTKAA